MQTRNLPNHVPHVYIEGTVTSSAGDEVGDGQHRHDSSSEEDYSPTVRDGEEDDDSEEDEEHNTLQLKIRVYNHTVEFRTNRRLVVSIK